MKTILAFLVLALPLAAVAADDPDASFYKNAAEAGISEVDLGNLAEQKASSQDVKDFGAKMVKDHSAANEKLQSLAASKSISLPTSASVGDMATKAKLELLTGDTFDKSYIKSQIKAHHEAIALFKKESTSGQDPEAKSFASATLPTLHEHLHMAYAAAKTLGISTK